MRVFLLRSIFEYLSTCESFLKPANFWIAPINIKEFYRLCNDVCRTWCFINLPLYEISNGWNLHLLRSIYNKVVRWTFFTSFWWKFTCQFWKIVNILNILNHWWWVTFYFGSLKLITRSWHRIMGPFLMKKY